MAGILTMLSETLMCRRCRRRRKQKGAPFLGDYDACPMTGNTDGVCPVTQLQVRGMAMLKKEEGNDLFRKGDFKGAVEKYGEACKMVPTEAVYFLNRSKAYTKLGHKEAALASSKTSIEADGGNVKAQWQYAQCLLHVQRKSDALTAIASAWKIIDKDDSDNFALVQLEREIQGLEPLPAPKDLLKKQALAKKAERLKEHAKFASAISGNSERKIIEELKEMPPQLQEMKQQMEQKKRAKIEEFIEARLELKRKAFALIERGAPPRSARDEADDKLAAMEELDRREKERQAKLQQKRNMKKKNDITHKTGEGVPINEEVKSADSTDAPDESNDERSKKEVLDELDEEKVQDGGDKTEVLGGAAEDMGKAKADEVKMEDSTAAIKKKNWTEAAYKQYDAQQEEELSIEGGHKYLARPKDVDLPDTYQDLLGMITAAEMYALGNCACERLLMCVFGDIFDVSDRPDKYGRRGIYWELCGKDITYGLSIGNDRPHLANRFYDLYKAKEPSKELMGMAGWLYHFRKEYGPPVGRLKEYEDEGYHLPEPPAISDDQKGECGIQ
eukprot:GEMP01019267.1.p1 GENE.GEMP01019267.1~~GEMP01019267.1.p1  ORF type:complete len:558 (+),score=179.73 GEMP01019267.1:98-1771(+)